MKEDLVKRIKENDVVRVYAEGRSPHGVNLQVFMIDKEEITGINENCGLSRIKLSDLKEVYIYPQIPSWTYEKRSGLKLTNDATLEIISGDITIINPYYTLENNPIFKGHSLIEQAFQRVNFRNRDYLLIQGQKSVYLTMFGGDGVFPILRMNDGLNIILDTFVEDLSNRPDYVGCAISDRCWGGMLMVTDSKNITPSYLDESSFENTDVFCTCELEPGKYKLFYEIPNILKDEDFAPNLEIKKVN